MSDTDSEKMLLVVDDGDVVADLLPAHPAAEPALQPITTSTKTRNIPAVSPSRQPRNFFDTNITAPCAPQPTAPNALSEKIADSRKPRMTSVDIFEMLTRITVIPCTAVHIIKLIDSSPLLTPEQVHAIKSVLPSYCYGIRPYHVFYLHVYRTAG